MSDLGQDPALGKIHRPGDEEPPARTLPSPGIPIVLTVSTNMYGQSDVNYIMTPEQACQILRELADQIETETQEQE